MAAAAGAGQSGPDTLDITAGGITVRMAVVGWADWVAIPRELDRLAAMPTGNPEDDDALRDALLAFAARIDAYAAGPVMPSRVPVANMRELVDRWTAGVRDAVVDPPSPGGSPSASSTSGLPDAP